MAPPSTPTLRELDALRAVCKPGGSMASAAYELGVSPHAIHKRLRSLYSRLGVNSAAQATAAIYERGGTL